MFPDDVPLESVSNFLKENYMGLIRHKQSWQILHALRIAQDLQVHNLTYLSCRKFSFMYNLLECLLCLQVEKIRLQVEGQQVLLNDQTPCSLCSKKFGKQRYVIRVCRNVKMLAFDVHLQTKFFALFRLFLIKIGQWFSNWRL